MRLYCEREGFIPKRKIALFREMTTAIEALPELDEAETVSCHVLTRILARMFPGVAVVDGHFQGRGSHHSWLDMGEGVIADVYPIGGIVPFLVDTNGYLNPWNRMYIEDGELVAKLRTDPETIVGMVFERMTEQRAAQG
jgi:hypothetical protein